MTAGPRLLVATRSSGKQREIRDLLAHFPFATVFPDDVGLYQRSAEETLESADWYEGNARAKAEYFARLSGLPTVADDSGLEVLALGGLPGVRSRRFALPASDQDAANNAELLRRLAGAPRERRGAVYRCLVVFLATPHAVPLTFQGSCAGHIIETPRGTGGFGYDPLFFSDDLGMSFGEAPAEDKHRISHRGRAFSAFAEWLANHPLTI